MVAIVAFLVAVSIIGGLLYVLVIQREVPGAVEQRFGLLEALPEDVGQWHTDTDSQDGANAKVIGLAREVRLFHAPGNGPFSRGRLLRQVRYRSNSTGELVRVDPDEVVRRRRVRPS